MLPDPRLGRQTRLGPMGFRRYAMGGGEMMAVDVRGDESPSCAPAGGKEGPHERDRNRNRPGDEQLVRRGAARWKRRGAPQRLWRTHYRQCRGTAERRFDRGGKRCPGQHHPRPQAHHLVFQATDGPVLLLGGGEEGPGHLLLRNRRGTEPRRAHQRSRRTLLTSGNRRHGPARNQGRRRGTPG